MIRSFSRPRHIQSPPLAKCSASLVLAALASLSAHAASDSWTGTADASWATSGNWLGNPATVPGTGDTATFNAASPNTTINLGAGVTISNIVFDTASVAAYTIGAGAVGSQTLALDNGGSLSLSSTAANNQLVNAALSLSSATNATATFANNSSSLLTIAGPMSATPTNGNSLLAVSGSGNVMLSGGLTENGNGNLALLKTGAGRLTITTNTVWSGTGAIGRVPTTNGYPLVTREGTLLFSGGSNFVNGEFVIGGVVADGGAGQNARVIVDGGTLNANNWFSIGRGNGVGGVSSDLVVTNGGAVMAANLSAGFDGGNAANRPKGSVSIHNNSSVTVTGNGTVNFAESTGSDFVLNLNDAAQFIATGTGAKRFGHFGNGVVNLNGSSSMILGNATAYIGYRTGTGVVNMASSGTFNNSGELRVGAADANGTLFNARGTLNISSGTVNLGAMMIGRGNNVASEASGFVNLNGGVLTITNDVTVGFAGTNNIGQLNINGGIFNMAPVATKWLTVGWWDYTRGELNINAGTVNLYNNTSIKITRGNSALVNTNVVTQNGGTVTFFADVGTNTASTGDLDMQYSGSAQAISTYNLNGGTLTVPRIRSSQSSGTRIFNFNGGTLRPGLSNPTFINLGAGNTRVNVRNGGAIINTDGKDATIVDLLHHSDIAEDAAVDGGLTKQGAGTLAISSASTFNGPLNVSGGTLALDATSGSALSVASLSLASGTGLRFTFSGTPGSPAINVAGGVTAGANITIHLAGSGFAVGQFTLIDYSGSALPNLNNFTLGALPAGVLSATLVNNTDNSSIDINITGIGQSLSWLGTNNLWDINTTFNWNNPSFVPSKYLEYAGNVGDLVRFDDTLDATALITNINLTTTLRPAMIVVDNASYPYSFTGAGSIAGGASLIKSNAMSLTLGTANSYTGGTHIYGGTVNVSSDSQLGAVAGPVTLGGGQLNFTANATVSRPISVTALSTLAAGAGSTLQVNSSFSGTERLNLDGPGVKVLGNSNRLWFHAVSGTTVLEGNASYTNSFNWTSIAPHYDANLVSSDAQLILRGNALLDAGNFDFNVSDSTVPNSGNRGQLDIQDNATLLFRNLWIGKGLMATGIVNQTGGLFNNAYAAGADLRIGGNAADQFDTYGRYQLSGGRAEFRRLLHVGAYGVGEMIVSGGQFSNSAAVVVGRFAGSRGSLQVSGGSFVVASDIIVGENGTGEMSVSGSGVARATSPLSIGGFGAPGTGTVSVVTGGRLVVPQVRMMPVAGLSTLNFNGGTLEASGPSSAFINNLTAANILSGGAIIDSSSNNITIPQALLNGGGNGGLTKVGTGALTLLGTNTYTGTTLVSGGSLTITPLHKTAGAVTVAGGASFGVFTATNDSATVGNITLGSAANDVTTLAFSFNSNPTTPLLQAGSITRNGTNVIRLAGTITAGIVPLVKYSSLTGSGVISTNITGPQGMTAVLSNDVANTTLYAVITGAPGIVWSGANSVPGLANLWANGVTNWLAAGNPAAYLEPLPPGDPVRFNDLGSGVVIVSNAVSPANAVISNNAVNYTFSGPGRISGQTGLTKQGTGTATMGIANDYAGATTVSAGTLQFGIANATGAGNLSVASGATLDLNGFAGSAAVLSGSGLINNTAGTESTLTIGSGNSDSTWSGAFTNATGGVRLIKVGTGTNTFTATNYLAGQNQVNGGKLVLPAGSGIAPVGTAEFWIAEGANTATVEVNGGFLGANNWFVVGRNNLAANGTLIVNSGTVQKSGGGNFVVGSLAATGTLIVNGGQVLNNANLWLGERTGAIAKLFLNGGLVQATQIRGNDNTGLPTTSEAWFNGGVLQASGSSDNFIGAPTVPYIQAGGLIFDTQGFGITNAAALNEDGNSTGGGLVKLGTGTLALTGANVYSGPTVVSNGTLLVNGSISGNATVKSGAALGGIGTVSGTVTVEAGGRLAAAGSDIGTFNLNTPPVLGGAVVADVNRNEGSPIADIISVPGQTITYGGTLIITNAGAALQVGDSFKLFDGGAYTGSFSIVSQTPGQSVTWNAANLTVDGTISVATVGSPIAENPTNITVSVTGSSLNLSWPESHLGWVLQAQTNALNIGLRTNWFDIAGSESVTNMSISVNKTNPAVFYRLRKP